MHFSAKTIVELHILKKECSAVCHKSNYCIHLKRIFWIFLQIPSIPILIATKFSINTFRANSKGRLKLHIYEYNGILPSVMWFSHLVQSSRDTWLSVQLDESSLWAVSILCTLCALKIPFEFCFDFYKIIYTNVMVLQSAQY